MISLERGFDHLVPQSSRRYDYWLGGKDNFEADRHSGDLIAQRFPSVKTAAKENRAFLRRVVKHLARDLGVRQFLDVGSGLPSAGNTHEVAQRINPAARVVYVDKDPVVLVHGRARLTAPLRYGPTTIIQADLRDPETILHSPELRDTLDLKEPVGLLLIAVLHYLLDTGQSHQIVKDLMSALAPGSYLALSTLGRELLTPAMAADFDATNQAAGIPVVLRTFVEISGYLAGLELAEPGIAPIHRWRPDPGPGPGQHQDCEIGIYGALARKP